MAEWRVRNYRRLFSRIGGTFRPDGASEYVKAETYDERAKIMSNHDAFASAEVDLGGGDAFAEASAHGGDAIAEADAFGGGDAFAEASAHGGDAFAEAEASGNGFAEAEAESF